MPCGDSNGWPEPLGWIEAAHNQTRLDNVTRILCEVITMLNKTYAPKTGEELLTMFCNKIMGFHQWQIEHEERDRLRKAAEAEADRLRAIRNDAVAKLTPEERKVLGV